MRLTTHIALLEHSHGTTIMDKLPSFSLKKPVDLIKSKLLTITSASNQKVAPAPFAATAVKNHGNTYIRVVKKQPVSSALVKDNAVYQDLRNYYKGQRMVANTTVQPPSPKSQQQSLEERHKIVKQYNQHKKEEHSIINKEVPDCVRRKARSNPNYLLILAMTQTNNNAATLSKVSNVEDAAKPKDKAIRALKKRNDEFVYGSPSRLRNEVFL